MKNNLFLEICNGNIILLKTISKIDISSKIIDKFIKQMESNIDNYNLSISSCYETYILFYLYKKIKDINECIFYLQKIR
jgi:hypothetical protein